MIELQTHSGFVLFKTPYGEADEIITVLLQDVGLRKFFVKGSRKSKKRYAGVFGLFSLVQFSWLEKSKSLQTARDVVLKKPLVASVVNDLKLYGFLNLLAEVTIAFHPDGEGGDETFLLWESVLKSIQENSLDFGQCLLDFLKLTGFAMNFSTCLECKSTLFSTPIVFDPERGGVLCGACVSHKVVSQWQIREEHNTEKLCSDDVVRVLCLAIERQLQRPLKSYAFLKAFLQQAA